jgi:hypothetical protein
MRWINHRLDDGVSVMTLELTTTEADAILKDMKTGDDSATASKEAFSAFREVADGHDRTKNGGVRTA